MFLDTTLGTVDDEDFDLGVGTRLDNTFGPRPSMSVGPAAGITGNQQAMDYLALSKMLAKTIRSNMMQFSQVITPMGGGAEPQVVKQPLPPEKGSTKTRSRSSRMLVVSAMPSRSLPSGQ